MGLVFSCEFCIFVGNFFFFILLMWCGMYDESFVYICGFYVEFIGDFFVVFMCINNLSIRIFVNGYW